MSNERSEISDRLESLREKLAKAAQTSGRRPDEISLLAVTKKVAPEIVRAAYEAGVRDFAENYIQEAVEKKHKLADIAVRWHLIGQLQSNKIKLIADKFDLVHAVDRVKIADELAKHTSGRQKILLEVNLANESSKGGCPADELPRLIEHVQRLSQIELRGLMFMAPLDLTADQQRRYYSQARELRDKLRSRVDSPKALNVLSMGTSHDFEAAVCEGATIVRLGTALFGERN